MIPAMFKSFLRSMLNVCVDTESCCPLCNNTDLLDLKDVLVHNPTSFLAAHDISAKDYCFLLNIKDHKLISS